MISEKNHDRIMKLFLVMYGIIYVVIIDMATSTMGLKRWMPTGVIFEDVFHYFHPFLILLLTLYILYFFKYTKVARKGLVILIILHILCYFGYFLFFYRVIGFFAWYFFMFTIPFITFLITTKKLRKYTSKDYIRM